jgi:hypothetical protein
MTTAKDLALYLKLDDLGQRNEIVDASGNDIKAVLEGSPTLVPDDKFGSCLHFDGQDDCVVCESLPAASADFSRGLTVEAWACVQSEEEGPMVVIALENANEQPIAFFVENSKIFLTDPEGGPIGNEAALKINTWIHLVATIDRDGNALLYRDGTPLETGPERKFQIPPDLCRLRIGEYQGYGFQGKLAHVRIYSRALSAADVRRDMLRDEMALSSFTASHPLDFRILDRDENAFLYVEDTEAETLDEFFMKNNHLELRFRRGLLSENSVKLLRAFQTSQFAEPKKDEKPSLLVLAKKLRGWHLFYKEHSGLGSASIYLLSKSAKTLKPSDADSDADMLAVTLSQITANRRGGARNTPFELRPGPLTKVDDGTPDGTPLVGSRIHSISVLSHRGRRRIPLHVGFVGSNTVLNDKETANSLTLRIKNVSHESISLDTYSDSPSRFIITFDEGEVQAMDWALGDSGQVMNIKVWAGLSLDKIDRQVHRTSEDPAEFTIEGVNLPDKLEAKTSIYVRLSNIKTAHPIGPANLYLHYENLPGYWDGQFVCPIQKTPLLYRSHADGSDGNRVGIGTNLTVGAQWASDPKAKAPDDGLLVQGNVSIGTFENRGSLHVRQEQNDTANWLMPDGRRTTPLLGRAAEFSGGGVEIKDVNESGGYGLEFITGLFAEMPTKRKNMVIVAKVTDQSDDLLFRIFDAEENFKDTSVTGLPDSHLLSALKNFLQDSWGENLEESDKEELAFAVRLVSGHTRIPLHLYNNATPWPALCIEHKNENAAVSVTQDGEGDAAEFKGGAGVSIEEVNSGEGSASLYVEQQGTGLAAEFEGGAGVHIIGVEHGGAALYVKQEGPRNAAVFEGGNGVDICGVTGQNNALAIHDNTTEAPTLFVGNKGTGPALHVKQEGPGVAAVFEGRVILRDKLGELNPVGGEENLRIVRGWVCLMDQTQMDDPDKPGVGSGFTWKKVGKGEVEVKFDEPFTDENPPIVTANAFAFGSNCYCCLSTYGYSTKVGRSWILDHRGFNVQILDCNGKLTDTAFNFIAIGGRSTT